MTEREFLERLDQEIDVWRRERLVTDDQVKAIRALYAAAELRPRRGLARMLAFLGALLIGIGAIVFLASNWAFLPGGVKLALIFGSMVAAYHGGYRLRYEGATYHGTGNALLFLGTLLFGGAIFMIAQGFHVNANVPSLLVLWAAGLLPMAVLLRSRPMVTLAVILLGIALGWEASFWLTDHRPDRFLLVYMLFGVLLYALGNLCGAFAEGREFRLPLGAFGLFLIFGALLPWTFPAFADEMDRFGTTTASALPAGALWRVGMLALASAAAVVGATARYRGTTTARGENAALAGLLLLAVVLFFAPALPSGLMALLFNLLMLAGIAGALVVGHAHREPAWINIGLLFFSVLVACRYFDLLWAWMPRELFLIGAGAILLFGGFALERTRRRMIQRTEEAEGNR